MFNMIIDVTVNNALLLRSFCYDSWTPLYGGEEANVLTGTRDTRADEQVGVGRR